MNFKIGDEVIFARSIIVHTKEALPVGSKFIIHEDESDGGTECGCEYFYSSTNSGQVYGNLELEHALVFNSPLYLALR